MQVNRIKSAKANGVVNTIAREIDFSKPIDFTFDGRRLQGYAGDTLASALLANNIHLVARSIKFHRPRGIMSAGLEEPSALVSCADAHGMFTPNLKVTEVILAQGLVARSQNNWPILRFDLLAFMALGSKLMGAGFYYKTFKWPGWGWHSVFEKLIRRFAGHGRIDQDRDHKKADEKKQDQRNKFCQLLVIGGGPAGLAAALTAGRAGVKVIVIHRHSKLGGSLIWRQNKLEVAIRAQWLSRTTEELQQCKNVVLLTDTLAFGQYDHGLVLAWQGKNQRQDFAEKIIFWKIRAEQIILAAGAMERPLVFSNNDRPGIMLEGSVRQYIYRYGVAPGKKAFIAIADPKERASTIEALKTGNIEIAHVLEPGDRLLTSRGRRRVNAVVYQSKSEVIKCPCDLVCVSAGWVPTAHLASHTGANLEYDRRTNTLLPPAQIGCFQTTGGCRGVYNISACIQDGRNQANNAMTALGLAADKNIAPEKPNNKSETIAIECAKENMAFIDFQNDVTRDDIEQAVDEGFDDVELVKRYTTIGMGTDQGKTSWANAISEFTKCVNRMPDKVGHTTFRPPYSPVSFATLVGARTGQNMKPIRYTPFHSGFENLGCVFQTSGDWLYSRYFSRDNETMEQAIRREVRAVRNGVGFVDMSTLGKIDVKGKDSIEFLSRIYCNNISTIDVGRLRYGLMLREDGIVYDDGTVARLDDEHYLLTTTTANAGSVWRWLTKLLQVQWPNLDVQITSVSDHWASLAIAGPQSCDLLNGLRPDFAVDRSSFPFASVRQGFLNGDLPCRIFSVSFSGELSYEINVPAGFADELLNRVLKLGTNFDVTPYGLETLDVLRIEKGHLAVGTEIDGRTTPKDLGLSKMVSTKKDFIGRTLMNRPKLKKGKRLEFVGFTPVDKISTIPAGALLTASPWKRNEIQRSQGKLTASVFSPTIDLPIALGLLEQGGERMGEHVWAVSPVANQSVEVKICPSCFYDENGGRLHG